MVPDAAAPTAPLIVKNALSIDVPLLVSLPSLATYKTLGAELIPEALELILTPAPMKIVELVTVTKPTLIVLLLPSSSIEDVPIVRIPVTLASPSTTNAVCAVPVCTLNPLLKVLNPNASWLTTSS